MVRVDVAAHHLALGGVGEHVLAEQRRHHQEGQDPQRQHVGQRADRHPAPGPERLEESVPDPDEQDHAAVHGDDPRQHQRGRRPVGLAEEPRAGHLLLEGRARQRRPDADEDDGQEPQEGGPAQEGPVLRIAGLRFHAFGQRDAAGDPEVHRLGARGEATEARAHPIETRCCRRHRALVHGVVSLACHVRALRSPVGGGTGPRRGSMCPQSIRNSIVTPAAGSPRASPRRGIGAGFHAWAGKDSNLRRC